MKDFYRIYEPWEDNIDLYREKKRETVLETIKPICEVFGIADYDYILNDEKERLVIEGTQIACEGNSIGATVMELIVFIFVKYGSDKLGAFKTQTLNQLKRCWIKEREDL